MVIQLPDGQVVDFPDDQAQRLQGLSPSQQLQVLQTGNWPSTPAGQVTGPMRYVEGIPSEVLAGVASGLGLPGDVANLVSRVVPEGVENWTESHLAPYLPGFMTRDFPTSQDLLGTLGPGGNVAKAVGAPGGLVNRSDLAPQGPIEQAGAAALRGVGSALPIGLATGGLGTALGLGATSGLGAEGASRILPGNPIAPIVGGALAGGLGGWTLGARGLESVAKGLGTSATPQEAGEVLQDSARNWRSIIMPQKLAQASAPLDAKVAPTTPVVLNNFHSALDRINSKFGSLQPAVDAAGASPTQRLAAGLDTVRSLPGEPVTASWAEARQLRSWLGDQMAPGSRLVRDIPEQDRADLYRALSTDLGDSAKAQGAEDEWNAYNKESTRLYGFAQGPLAKIISTTNPDQESITPEVAALRTMTSLKKGGTEVNALRQEIPEGVDELSASILRSNPQAWNKMAPEAKVALVPDSGTRSAIETNIPPRASPMANQNDILASIRGGDVGEAAAGLISRLGGEQAGRILFGEAGGRLAGMLEPAAARVLRAAAKPRVLQGATLGANAGNALTP